MQDADSFHVLVVRGRPKWLERLRALWGPGRLPWNLALKGLQESVCKGQWQQRWQTRNGCEERRRKCVWRKGRGPQHHRKHCGGTGSGEASRIGVWQGRSRSYDHSSGHRGKGGTTWNTGEGPQERCP